MMMKKNILMVSMAMLLAVLGVANAATVFNVDINGEIEPGVPDLAPFGEYTDGHPGAFSYGTNRWNVFVGGWAVRLVPDEIPEGANWQITKAYIGWGNPGSVVWTYNADNTLFLDYASKKADVNAPMLYIVGGTNPDNGTMYSQGVYDLYLYGNGESTFNVTGTSPQTDPDIIPTAVTYMIGLGGHNPADANYVENYNYAVVPTLDSSQTITVEILSGGLAGMQLVDKGILIPQAFPLPGDSAHVGTDFNPAWCSFGYDKSRIGTGPFVTTWTDSYGLYGILAQGAVGEWVTYEVYVADGNYAGFYEINCAYCADPDGSGTAGGVLGKVGFKIDNGPVADVNISDTGTWSYANGWTPFKRVYLSKGYHRLTFSFESAVANIWGFRARRATSQAVTSCLDAQMKGSELLPSDLNADCITNFKDLAMFASEWLNKCVGCP